MSASSFISPISTKTGALLLAILLFTGFACDSSVDPFIGTELPFTAWGMVNPDADTQAVRIFEIDDVLRLISPDPLDANVSILNLTSGDRHALQDSVIQLENGDYRHVFWADFDVDHLETYRLEAEQADGQVSFSEDVTVPGPVEMTPLSINRNAVTELVQKIHITGDPPALPQINVTYSAHTVSAGRKQIELPVTISYSNNPVVARDSLFLILNYKRDYDAIQEVYSANEISGILCIDDVEVELHVGNESWESPSGVFDPNFLVEPGTFTNIENGFGYFGAGFTHTISFLPENLFLIRAGFRGCAQ